MENEIKNNYLLDKSIKSFLLSIEIFNKLTIDYRLEGCVFFLINSWELLLKYKLILNGENIFYKDKPNRSLSIRDCIKKIFNNEKDPIVQNLNVIITLRNTATHLIIPETEIQYMPFLAMCVKNYAEKLKDWANVKISDYIKTNFLSLFANNTIANEQDILNKYGKNILDFFNNTNQELSNLLNCEKGFETAMAVNINICKVNNKNKADVLVYSTNNPTNANVKIVKEKVNPNITHPYTHHQVTEEISNFIENQNIPFKPIRKKFTTSCLDLIIKHFDFEKNEDYITIIKNGKTNIKKYSNLLITKIETILTENPNIVIELNKKRLAPGAKASRH